MAQTVFEVFDCPSGKTLGFREGADVAKRTCERAMPNAVLDYLPAKEIGFYVVDMNGFVKFGPFNDRDTASRKSDFENMATDVNSYHVTEHRF